MTRLRFTIPLTLLLLTGCFTPTSDTQLQGGPPVRASLTGYWENIDADAEQELILYVELYDKNGDQTRCQCEVHFEAGDSDYDDWTTIRKDIAQMEDWKQVTAGKGSFARSAIIWATSIDESKIELLCYGHYIDIQATITIRTQTFADQIQTTCPW